RHSSRHGRRYDGAVRTAGDSRAIGHDAAFGGHHADGKHAGLAAVPHEGGQSDAAFRRFFPGCTLSRRRPLNRMAGDFSHGGHWRCLLRVRFTPLPQRDIWGLNEQEKAPMRLNYASIASEAKRRDDSPKTLRKGDRSMDARKHHSAIGYLSIWSIGYLSIWSREDWRKDVPRILPALFTGVAQISAVSFAQNEWKIHMAQFSEQLADLS